MREDVRRLAEQAGHDLRHAEANIAIGAFEVTAFLAQQAAEKALKAAWIVVRREPPPMTHTLPVIGEGIDAPPEIMEDLLELNADYTVSRYPDAANGVPHQVYSKGMAVRKIEAARRVLAWAEARWTA
jgi:HEPN domain-containing protein